jgi:hypothetical protein
MSTFIAILITIGIGILIYNFYSTYSIRSFFKTSNRRPEINDQKYWELKYKIESLITISSVIIAIAAYLGISTLNDVKDQVTREIKPQVDSITSQIAHLKDSLKKVNDTLAKYKSEISFLDSGSKIVKEKLLSSKGGIDKLLLDVAEISRKNKIQAQVFIVNNLSINIDNPLGGPSYKINFSSLTTSTGDKLPVFNKPPLVVCVAKDGGGIYARNISTTSLEFFPADYLSAFSSTPNKTISLVIFQTP